MAATRVVPNAAAPAKPAAAAGSAKPGTAGPAAAQGDGKAKKEKIVRTYHPLLKPEEKDVKGKKKIVPTAKLKEIPSDFDAKKHKPLMRKDFDDESQWFELRARWFDAQAAKMRAEAVTAKTTGSSADRVKAKRLASMAKKVAELQAQLKGQGVDVDAIMKAAMASTEPVADAAKA